jgi:hypothetical protein
MRSHKRLAAIVLLTGALTTACAEAPSDEHIVDEPVTVEHIDGSELSRLTLEPRAAERLAIETAETARAKGMLAVPAGAVLVDPEGRFWVYTNPEPLVYVREQIRIHHEDADEAFLTDGPAPGTPVVITGAAELYGAEFGIGH